MDSLLYLLFPVAFIGGYYFWYFRKVKAAGGYGAIADRIQAAKFGLQPGETVVPHAQWRGMFYIGPLLPETVRSTGEQVVDFFTNTTYRGRMVEIALTTGGRLVVSGEPLPDAPVQRDAFGDVGYRPVASFTYAAKPRFVLPQEAFGNTAVLQKTLAQPPSQAGYGTGIARWELVVLQPAGGAPMVLWVEPAARGGVQAFCAS